MFRWFPQVPASGSFQLQLMSFVVNSWRTSDGQCCDGSDPSSTSTCHAPCRTFFRLCLSHYQPNLKLADLDLDLELTCTFGNLTTPVVNATVLTTSSRTSSTTSPVVFVNVPVQLQFDFTWPVSILFILHTVINLTWRTVVCLLCKHKCINPFTADPVEALHLSYLSNPPFLIFDIRALWRSGLSARAPECQKL